MAKKNKLEETKKLQNDSINEALHKERMERCVPVAEEILKIIANGSPYLGEVSQESGEPIEEANDKYNQLAGQVLELLLEKNIKFTEKLFVFALVEQAVSLTKEKVQNSLERSMEKAEASLWGIDDIMNLKLSDIDKQLRS